MHYVFIFEGIVDAACVEGTEQNTEDDAKKTHHTIRLATAIIIICIPQ